MFEICDLVLGFYLLKIIFVLILNMIVAVMLLSMLTGKWALGGFFKAGFESTKGIYQEIYNKVGSVKK